jgi:hypothetical protein
VATERQPRNPYIVGLGVVGGIAGAVAATLAWIARWPANDGGYTPDGTPLEIDPAVLAGLFAWADMLGLLALVAIAGALVIAGARWAPKAPATNKPQLRLDGTLYPPGGLTDAERRLLDGDEAL